jgi:hypothetical protein
VGIYLGQMPPAEMARLKAEIAETLIANFSYPRFYDYRVNTLRMRAVDRAKRQEVWTFLSAFDFNTFSRIDVVSPDFQHQVERLLIQFVQRNRAFFGQQGRKRMSDVRALISSSSTSVTDGLRKHLSGQAATPFGHARPVISWSKSNGSGQLEPGWEQISNPTMLLQQQLQEVRGESQPAVNGDTRPISPSPAANGAVTNGTTTTPSRRAPRLRATTHGSSNGNEAASTLPTSTMPSARPTAQDEKRTTNSPSGSLPRAASGPLAPQSPTVPAAEPVSPAAPPIEAAKPPASHDKPVLRVVTAGDAPMPSAKPDETVMVSEEDVVIFEELRNQLLVWLRVEVVRAGIDLAGQSPAQLLEIVEQQGAVDETRLQIVSTLLDLSNQVIANRYATVVEYKQAMMFYLIHTRRYR